MSYLPSQTSYFSISTFLSTKITTQTSIALDIVRQHHNNLKNSGKNVNILTIQGYGEHITFEEACLGTWMVFDKLFGIYPPDLENVVGTSLIGWNREVTDPTIDIPIALKLFDQLSAPTVSYEDKWTRMETIQKLFYRNYTENYEQRFLVEEPYTYELLRTINPLFYNWILKNLEEIDKAVTYERLDIDLSGRRYIFDLTPVSLNDNIFNFNESMVLANKFFTRFLTVFEQVLYSYTKQIFPLKLYATIGYLFNAYIRVIMNFLKPYHAKLLEKAPILRFGDDIFDSVMVGNEFRTTFKRQLIESVVNKVFDAEQSTPTTYDNLHNIREKILMDVNQNILETIKFGLRIDNTAFRYDSNVENNVYMIHNEYQIYTQGPKSYTFTGHTKLDWQFWIPAMAQDNDLGSMTWDNQTGVVTNTWDRDIIVIANKPIRFETETKAIEDGSIPTTKALLHSIVADCDDVVRFAFNFRYFVKPRFTKYYFDTGATVQNYDLLKDIGRGEWWVYREGWNRISLPVSAYYDEFGILKLRGTNTGEGFGVNVLGMMTKQELANIITPAFKMGYFWPAVYLPVGASFTSLVANFTIRQKVFPQFDITH